jgi:hypothetical protein
MFKTSPDPDKAITKTAAWALTVICRRGTGIPGVQIRKAHAIDMSVSLIFPYSKKLPVFYDKKLANTDY